MLSADELGITEADLNDIFDEVLEHGINIRFIDHGGFEVKKFSDFNSEFSVSFDPELEVRMTTNKGFEELKELSETPDFKEKMDIANQRLEMFGCEIKRYNATPRMPRQPGASIDIYIKEI